MDEAEKKKRLHDLIDQLPTEELDTISNILLGSNEVPIETKE
jgi:hypothetical protein